MGPWARFLTSKRGSSWTAAILVILLGSVVGIAGGTFLASWMGVFSSTHTGLGDLFAGQFGGERYVRILMIGEDDTAKKNKNGNGLIWRSLRRSRRRGRFFCC